MPAESIHPLFFRHPVSAAGHLLVAAWAGYATAVLARLGRGDAVRRRCVTAFGLSMTALYAASGLYHAIPAERGDLVAFVGLLDLSAIHLLIAGTCTAMAAVLPPTPRKWLLVAAWSLAAGGIAAKWLLPLPAYPVTIGLYAASGAVALAALPALGCAAGGGAVGWVVGGALVYGVGAACEVLRWPVVWPGVIGPHEVLHVCDVGGTVCHVVFVSRHVVRRPLTPPAPSPTRGEGGPANEEVCSQEQCPAWPRAVVTPPHPPAPPLPSWERGRGG